MPPKTWQQIKAENHGMSVQEAMDIARNMAIEEERNETNAQKQASRPSYYNPPPQAFGMSGKHKLQSPISAALNSSLGSFMADNRARRERQRQAAERLAEDANQIRQQAQAENAGRVRRDRDFFQQRQAGQIPLPPLRRR
jgi:hypothetical protein